jgi:hypothetical protein
MTNTQVRRVMGSKSFRESAVANTHSQTMTQTLTATAMSAGISSLGIMGCYTAVQHHVLINEESSVNPADFVNVYAFAFAGFDKLKIVDMRGRVSSWSKGVKAISLLSGGGRLWIRRRFLRFIRRLLAGKSERTEMNQIHFPEERRSCRSSRNPGIFSSTAKHVQADFTDSKDDPPSYRRDRIRAIPSRC